MAYCTPAEFLQRYDVRLIGELVRDNGVREDPTTLLTEPILLAVLVDASAAVDAAVFVGDRYTPAQMLTLSTTAAAFVRRVVSDLALIYLKRRRGRFDPEKDGALLKEVNETLTALRDGKDMLLLTGQTEAPASVLELVRPNLVNVSRPNTIRRNTRNYYPNDLRRDRDVPN